MKNYSMFLSLAVAAVLSACQPQLSQLDSKKKDSESPAENSYIAKKVHALKKEKGSIQCSGVDSKLNLIRTTATINNGELSELTVAAYANKEDPSKLVNDLTPDLKKYELFRHELKSKALDLELDLEGKKFAVELVAEMNGQARKIYDLEIRVQNDGEGSYALNAFLSYKNTSMSLDLSEVLMGCSVH